MPKVSIIIACYNYGQYIPEAIDSVLAQTYQDYEAIIVDDCSNDGTTPAVLAEQVKRDKRIKLITNEKNIGAYPSRNRAIKQAKGKYITVIDADDTISPVFLERMITKMESSDADVVYTHFKYSGLRNSTRYYPADQRKIKRILPYKAYFPIWALHRKTDWEAFGGYSEEHRAGGDRNYWLHFVEADKNLVLVDEVLYFYRTHKGSLSSTTGKLKAEKERIVRKNHPNIYKGFKYYGNFYYFKYVVRPALFQLRTRKGRRIFRLLGITFYEDK